MGWKTSADVSWLAREHIAKLFVGFFKIASNGVLSSKKLRSALVKLQTEKHRLNFGKQSDGDFFDKMDEQLRVAAKHYREMKKDSHTYRRAMKKASEHEKQQIDLVLSYLDVDEPQTGAGTGPSTAVVTAELGTAEKTGPGEETASSSADPVAASIFSRVLSKKDSGEVQEPGHSATGKEKASSSVPEPVAKRTKVAVSYEELLASYGLDSKESEELAAWMLMDLPEKKPRVMRKQKAKASAKAKTAAVAKCKGKAKPKGSAKAKASGAPEPAKEATAFPKTSWWHRRSSAAYH